MEIQNALRAEVLTEALPYIQKYTGKVVVVKYGGSAMTDPALKEKVMGDIVLLSLVGVKVVLVHGGGPEINEMLARVGKKSEFCEGLRVTDAETIDIVQMVLAGKVNKDLVNLLQSKGGRAVGISGIDAGLIEAQVKDERLGYVGRVTNINIGLVNDLLNSGYIPVISTVACDRDANTYNINADTAAAQIAGAMDAESLILVTDTPGILRDKDDPATLIAYLTTAGAKELFAQGIIAGGMIPKVDCCTAALEAGVSKVFILDGRVPHSILLEMLTDEGAGTMVTKE